MEAQNSIDITEKGYWNSSPVKNYGSVFYLQPKGNSSLFSGPFFSEFGLKHLVVDDKVVHVPHDESLRKFFMHKPGETSAEFHNFVCPFISFEMDMIATGDDSFRLNYTIKNRAFEDKKVDLVMSALSDRGCESVESHSTGAEFTFDLNKKIEKHGSGTVDFTSLREWYIESEELKVFLSFPESDVKGIKNIQSCDGIEETKSQGIEFITSIDIPANSSRVFELRLAFNNPGNSDENEMLKEWGVFAAKIPHPDFDDSQQKLAYYKSWYILFFNEVKRKGIHWCLTGLGFPSVWVWDTSPFIANAYMDFDPFFVQGLVDAQLDSLKETGMMPLHVLLGFLDKRERKDEITQIPLVADTAWKVFERTGDMNFAKKAYRELGRNYDWYEKFRKPSGQVPLWGIDDKRAPYHYGPESGMDNCPIYDNGPAYSISINSAKVSFEAAMCNFAEALEKNEESQQWKQRKESTQAFMLENMWNDEDSYYYALTYQLEQIRLKSSDIYTGFYLNIFPKDKAQRVARVFEDEFLTEYGLTSVSMREECFDPSLYALGSVWPFMNYMAYKGLYDYECYGVAKKVVKGIVHATNQFPGVFECFNPEEKTLGRLKDGPICIPHMSFCAAGIICMILTNCKTAFEHQQSEVVDLQGV
ncbi:MAG: MGH1-like glycoside hydrolase domain-containing protein [Sedimentisphaeraceae bacterium JB056]